MQVRSRSHFGPRPRTSRGFTILESALAMLIIGLTTQGVLVGQQLITNARVRGLMAQQNAVEAAFYSFQDRYRALPGDYAAASANLDCGVLACLNGNGNGRIEPGTAGQLHEDILAWHHLTASGLLAGEYRMFNSNVVSPAFDNTPTNAFGGYLQIVSDSAWGYGGNTAVRHNVKTGDLIPVAILAEVDRKIDDGLPGSGRLQFSTYAGLADAPTVTTCMTASSPTASWNIAGAESNCGAATLLY